MKRSTTLLLGAGAVAAYLWSRRDDAPGMGAAPKPKKLGALTREQRQKVILDREARKNAIAMLKAQTAAEVKASRAGVATTDAAAAVALQDAASVGSFTKAIPWVLGAAVAAGAVYFLRKKGGRR